MKKTLLIVFLISIANFSYSQSNFLLDTTLIVNNNSIKINTKKINNNSMLFSVFCNSEITTIDTIHDCDALFKIELIDFDKDKNLDLMLTYIGNNPTYLLYLFDSENNSFRFINNYMSFPDAIQLRSNSSFYYSYSRAGCADFNWESRLFTIENYKIVEKGYIWGQGCEFETDKYPQEINIYKITNDDKRNKVEIETLPFLQYIPNFGDKWDFLNKYWNENYKKFE